MKKNDDLPGAVTIQYINIPFREITHAAPNKANTIEITKISEKGLTFL